MTQDRDQPDSIRLSWSEPKYITGPLHGYTLFYKQVNSNKEEWKTLSLPASLSSFRISKFNVGAKYTGYVVPVDNAALGTPSNKAAITTLSGTDTKLSHLLFFPVF